ncbi:MAG: hypothetical protein J7621_23365 [Niastella sp.]|nr:hypothetical protein [Niastella sp.]
MPVFNDFSENGDLLQTREEPLNAGNLERYIKEYGIEKAKIYLDAVKDFNKQLYQLLYFKTSTGFTPNTRAYIDREGTKIIMAQDALIESAEKLISSPKPDDNLRPTTG